MYEFALGVGPIDRSSGIQRGRQNFCGLPRGHHALYRPLLDHSRSSNLRIAAHDELLSNRRATVLDLEPHGNSSAAKMREGLRWGAPAATTNQGVCSRALNQ